MIRFAGFGFQWGDARGIYYYYYYLLLVLLGSIQPRAVHPFPDAKDANPLPIFFQVSASHEVHDCCGLPLFLLPCGVHW